MDDSKRKPKNVWNKYKNTKVPRPKYEIHRLYKMISTTTNKNKIGIWAQNLTDYPQEE